MQGNDRESGTSPSRAWASIGRVNAALFEAGDKILFRSGCRWVGQLRPKGCGTEGRPIRIGRYGKGALPCISQGSEAGIVLLLLNQDQWEIEDIEIDGGEAHPDALVSGIQVQATDAGRVMRHIVIRNCIVRNTLGSVKLYESSAIWVGVPGWNHDNGLTTGFDDVLIENNRICNTDRNGILVWTSAGHGPNSQFRHELIPSTRVIIRNNLIEDIGGDAILVLGSDYPLIEGNTVRRCCLKTGDPALGRDYNPSSAAIWLHHCKGGIMQHNAVYDCHKQPWNNDGMAYDFDFNCTDCILQYNLSANNAGGFLLIMNTAVGNMARYNISENDLDHVFICVGHPDEGNMVYNNTFYNNSGKSYIVPRATFQNNIFMAEGDAQMSVENPETGRFLANCYAGNWQKLPSDSLATRAQPLFFAPGQAYDNMKNIKGYSLQRSSPCRTSGIVIEHNGGHDILGGKVTKESRTAGAVVKKR